MTKIDTVMLQFIVKAGKIGFWILVPLVLISNTGSVDGPNTEPLVENGNYLLKSTGALNSIFSGQIFFTEKIDSLTAGKRFSRFELRLDSVDETVDHHMGFVLSKNIIDSGGLEGNYKVNAKSIGILNKGDGVFGFADIGVLGEQPFFAESGSIRITDMSDNLLHGNLKITLRDFDGRSIDILGSFIAKKGSRAKNLRN